jgi:glycosyltransferase involved in cell wall biosynthesis
MHITTGYGAGPSGADSTATGEMVPTSDLMMPLPSVSVVIPVLNGAATIGDTLDSLMAQSPVPGSMEIIVVDNGSTDATQEIVLRYPAVTLLHESRRGPAAARDTGLRAARGEVILYCDADTLLTRRWVAEFCRCFTDSSVMLAAGCTLSFPPVTPADHYLSTMQVYEAEPNITRPVLPFAASVNLGVRREAALSIGGWDVGMMTSEDVDFCTRLLARYPGPIAYAAKAVLFHRGSFSDKALKKKAWTYGEGLADIYRRYPSIVPWGARQYVHLAAKVVTQSAAPSWLKLRNTFGKAPKTEVQNARYHRVWAWWFWAGFFSFRRSGKYRTEWSA